MKTTLSVLCDNNILRSGLIGEHGFSLLIERDDETYLFDTGPGMSLPINLKAVNKDLANLKRIFISHGHYDHTGGMKWVIDKVGKVEVVAHPEMFARHMIQDTGDLGVNPRYIGCPHGREELERSGAIFRFLDHTAEVSPGVWFVTGIDVVPEKRPKDARLVVHQGGGLAQDPMKDDASLLLETEGGPVLILGCAHSGVLNILGHVSEKMQVRKLRAVLGGTHLMFYGPKELKLFLDRMDQLSVDLVGVSHCTGMQATIELAKKLGDRFVLASAGTSFDF